MALVLYIPTHAPTPLFTPLPLRLYSLVISLLLRALIEAKQEMKLFFAALLLCSLLFSSSFLEPVMAKSSFCTKKCNTRCANAGIQDRCLKYCGICCEQCKCVPSGTYGNKHECPCYRDKRNSKGKPKCP